MNRNRFSAVATITVPTLGIKGKKLGKKEKYVETINPAPATPAGEPLGEIEVEISEETAKKLKLGWSVAVAKNEETAPTTPAAPTEPSAPIALLATSYPKELPHWNWSQDRPLPAAHITQNPTPLSADPENKDALNGAALDKRVEQIWQVDRFPPLSLGTPLSLGNYRQTNKSLGRKGLSTKDRGRQWQRIDEQGFHNAAERARARTLSAGNKASSPDGQALSPSQLVTDVSGGNPSALQVENENENKIENNLQATPLPSALAPVLLLATTHPESLPPLIPPQKKPRETPAAPQQTHRDPAASPAALTSAAEKTAAHHQVPVPSAEASKDRNILEPPKEPTSKNLPQPPLPASPLPAPPSLFRSRSFAALIDISVACSFFVLGLLLFPDPPRVLPFVFAAFYLLTKDSLGILNGQSIGKKIMRLRVVNQAHRSLAGNYKLGLMHNLSWLLAPIEFAILSISKDELSIAKRLGDDWAKTEVITEEKTLPRKSKWLP